MHVGIGLAIQLQLTEHAAGLVGHVDEHGKYLLHDQDDGTWTHAPWQLSNAPLAQVRARETLVVEEDVRAPAASWSRKKASVYRQGKFVWMHLLFKTVCQGEMRDI